MWVHPTASSVHWENEAPIKIEKTDYERSLIGSLGWVFLLGEDFELTHLPFSVIPTVGRTHPTASSVHWESEVPIRRQHERNWIGGPGWVFFARETFELTQLPFPVIPRTDSNIEAQTVAS